MAAEQALGDQRRWLFAPIAQPPNVAPATGRIVCNCFGVSENQVKEQLAAGADLAAVQAKLKCGTSCGSCLPELRRMAAGVGNSGAVIAREREAHTSQA